MRSNYLSVFLVFSFLSTQAFSEDFWWGISTSSYQTEDSDGSFATDWDKFIENGKLKHSKENGTESFTRYDRDFDELERLGVSHYRYSIEWARVEPEPGVYNLGALNHYIEMARELKRRGIEPVLCLWHFTFPDWSLGERPEQTGWLNRELQDRWEKYVRLIVEAFSEEGVRIYAPMNEPNAQALAAYFLGIFPPMAKFKARIYHEQIASAVKLYNQAADIIHGVNADNKVMTVQNLIYWDRSWIDVFGYFRKLGQRYNYDHLDGVHEKSDLIGFNYYYRTKASPLSKDRQDYADGISYFIKDLTRRYDKPIVITENGKGTANDAERVRFMKNHIEQVLNTRNESYKVVGYFFWSLIDNYEWSAGYTKQYGIYSLNADGELIAKPSAEVYKELIELN